MNITGMLGSITVLLLFFTIIAQTKHLFWQQKSKLMLYAALPLFFTHSIHAQQLAIGTISDDPPFEYLAGKNKIAGFDIDIMTTICQRIGSQCTFKMYDFHKLFEILNKGEVDLTIAAIIITPQRRQKVLFSLPYKSNNQQLIVLGNSAFHSPTELMGKKVGVYKTSPDEAAIYRKFSGKVQLKTYEHVNDMIYALKHKQVEAIVLEYPRAIYWVSAMKSFRLLGERFPVGEGYGIAAKLGRDDLIKKINQALESMEDDGTYLQIYQRYF